MVSWVYLLNARQCFIVIEDVERTGHLQGDLTLHDLHCVSSYPDIRNVFPGSA